MQRHATSRRNRSYLAMSRRNGRRAPKKRGSSEPGSSRENAKRRPSRTKPSKPFARTESEIFPTPREAERRWACVSRAWNLDRKKKRVRNIEQQRDGAIFNAYLFFVLLFSFLERGILFVRRVFTFRFFRLGLGPSLEFMAQTCHVCLQQTHRVEL